MITVLIVDDNPDKIRNLVQCLTEIPELTDKEITIAPDMHTGKKFLSEISFDLLILDLSLPERFGDTPEKDGGSNFLDEIELDGELILPFHIIGITAYKELKSKFQNNFNAKLWHLIHYEQEFNEWYSSLQVYVRYLIKSKTELKNPSNVKYEYDLGIITALNQIELDSVLKLQANWQRFSRKNDHTIYYKGVIWKGNEKKTVVAASTDQMGLTAATMLAQKLIENFRPRLLCMTGIAAGIKNKTEYGDIVVADLTWDYGSGKLITSDDGKIEFKQDPRPLQLDPSLKAHVKDEEMSQSLVSSIQDKWSSTNGTPVVHKLKMLCGPIASGSYVIENIKKVEEIVDQQRKILAIDMETYGVFFAAYYSTDPKPKVMSIKSICDFGDDNKSDKYQKYAAFTSANFLFEFVLKYL